jgi:hypothetical protein
VRAIVEERPAFTPPKRGERRTDKHAGFLRLILVITACALVAHGCHVGDHGDADLVIRLISAAGSEPAAASP